MSMKDLAVDAGKAAPPVGVVSADRFTDISMNDVVLYLTAIYTVVQLGFYLYDRYEMFKARKRDATKD